MSVADAHNADRVAQPLIVELRASVGSPPRHTGSWSPVSAARVDRIDLNHGSRPSSAIVTIPDLRWNSGRSIPHSGAMVRIRTAEADPSARSVVFQGFITSHRPRFTGGSGDGAREENRFGLSDYRWLLSATSPVAGCYGRSPDDYTNFGTASQAPKADSYTWLRGRRAIFNANGKPNRDPDYLQYGSPSINLPLFADPDVGQRWTCREMIAYCLSPLINRAKTWLPIDEPLQIASLQHSDFERQIGHVPVDSLSALEAIAYICSRIGWSFREDYYIDAGPQLVFYKPGDSYARSRSGSYPTILHELHAPAAGESIATATAAGRKLLWSMALNRDITTLTNAPWAMGAPDRFEFTAELVPAWEDADLVPDTSDSNAHLYYSEADLQSIADPDSYSFFKYYHASGSRFRRNVGRKWALNESGRYSIDADRGEPFDFTDVIDSKYLLDADGNRLYGPFNRRLLPCLTRDKDNHNSVGIVVDISLDGGTTWQRMPAAIANLDDECGIYINEQNLSEMIDRSLGTISGGDLDGVEKNFWTSLCDDKLNSRSFKAGEWKTRVRVTASVQMDQRLARDTYSQSAFSSPFAQIKLHDFSDRYARISRCDSSVYHENNWPSEMDPMPAYQVDSDNVMADHLEAIRKANQDASVSGVFVLDRLWLGDGSARPEFMLGDGIERITGRNYPLAMSNGASMVYPEVVQITYLPAEQRMRLVTRDLRFAETTVT